MTHEESQRIAEFYLSDCSCEQDKPCKSCLLAMDIDDALSLAEKKGREEGKNLLKACESAQHSIWKRVDDAYEDGWNEARKWAVGVVAEHFKAGTLHNLLDTGDKLIEKLRGDHGSHV